ncbi:alpha/beta fold hydrolase [Jeotgalibacillus terrae]|uniref:Alpha/beta fold hydrolase n=1 Tax=Jeotgalibacillus terrae TaxID=587735 RepID=A0ABW5ZLH3_9BACL|nr:alpha/beta hydrolase [Jeotgalibacillus terrae]MBM7578117.1 pimeloyl-ACP methyl ester carboxylesterase [Jeotgalibacillus terrae]
MTTVTIPKVSEFIEVEGTRYAYRKFGKETGIPLLFLIHFRGTMENWDPNMIEPIAKKRPVILFDNKGVGETRGQTPITIAEMAKDAGAFIKALGLEQVDILGFSIGGMVAQELALQHGDLVRRMILAGTSPESGVNPDPEIIERMNKNTTTQEEGLEDFMFFFYSPTDTSRSLGMASLQRIFGQKTVNSSDQVQQSQLQAIAKWAQQKEDHQFEWLQSIDHPVLVTNGVTDIMVPTKNSYILTEKLPNAQLIIYPDSGHGHLFQYPEMFAEHVNLFLNSQTYEASKN